MQSATAARIGSGFPSGGLQGMGAGRMSGCKRLSSAVSRSSKWLTEAVKRTILLGTSRSRCAVSAKHPTRPDSGGHIGSWGEVGAVVLSNGMLFNRSYRLWVRYFRTNDGPNLFRGFIRDIRDSREFNRGAEGNMKAGWLGVDFVFDLATHVGGGCRPTVREKAGEVFRKAPRHVEGVADAASEFVLVRLLVRGDDEGFATRTQAENEGGEESFEWLVVLDAEAIKGLALGSFDLGHDMSDQHVSEGSEAVDNDGFDLGRF